jgi:predicted RNA-binding protein YlqC (UPF0109 family)
VDETEQIGTGTNFEASVASSDAGKVIGKSGRTARALGGVANGHEDCRMGALWVGRGHETVKV